jgi:anaerobic selenocysteine-containing dehydrogenase
MSMVHASRGKLKPASVHLRSEPAIIAGMAAAAIPGTKVDWAGLIADYDRIRDKIEAVFPEFNNFNERIRHPGGFRLPLPAAMRAWATPTGKANFIVPPGVAEDPTLASPEVLKLASIRSHDQYNTTIYGLDDRYRGVFGRRDVLFVNEADLAARGLEHGDVVKITTAVPGAEAYTLSLTAIAYNIPAGSVAAYYPEANILIPLDYQDRKSGTPSYKSIPVTIAKAA